MSFNIQKIREDFPILGVHGNSYPYIAVQLLKRLGKPPVKK